MGLKVFLILELLSYQTDFEPSIISAGYDSTFVSDEQETPLVTRDQVTVQSSRGSDYGCDQCCSDDTRRHRQTDTRTPRANLRSWSGTWSVLRNIVIPGAAVLMAGPHRNAYPGGVIKDLRGSVEGSYPEGNSERKWNLKDNRLRKVKVYLSSSTSVIGFPWFDDCCNQHSSCVMDDTIEYLLTAPQNNS
ncbi:hypothetical protein J6590_027878 [Homalodisca vitripennis]|nr:hypothetical protein J6590_027878 [Homalodisca vitripennis]